MNKFMRLLQNPTGAPNLVVRWSMVGPSHVSGPAYRMIDLPIGAVGKYGPITRHTSAWARISYEKVADRVTLQRPRQSGHEIEGRVTIRGKSYRAFTSGGENPDGGDGMIIVRMR